MSPSLKLYCSLPLSSARGREKEGDSVLLVALFSILLSLLCGVAKMPAILPSVPRMPLVPRPL